MWFRSKKMINSMQDVKLQRQVCGKLYKSAAICDALHPVPAVVGKDASVAMENGGKTVVIRCAGKIIFDYPAEQTQVLFHMGLGGLDLIYRNQDQKVTVTLHHVLHVQR